jgi:phosphatidylserine/phosphatidylglycerophosphate/cardiolipin synthase-like enzyme
MGKKWVLLVMWSMAVLQAKEDKITVPKVTPEETVQHYCMASTGETDVVLFAPDEGRIYKNILRGLIRATAAGGSIQVAAFRFTEKELAHDLLEAHERGVTVEVVFDPGAVTAAFYSSAFTFSEAGIAVFQYQPKGLLPLSQRNGEEGEVGQRIAYPTIMHQKTMIFRNTLGGRDFVAFGSFNFTTAACYGNEEAMQVRSKPEIVNAFATHFEKLKHRSYLITPYRVSQVSVVRNLKYMALRVVRSIR